MTAQLAAQAHRVAGHHPEVAAHPWLAAATDHCLDAIGRISDAPHAIELMFALHFLDAAAPGDPRARALVDRLVAYVPADGTLPVAGGAEGEVLRLLDLTPRPGTPSRAAFRADAVAADLRRLAAAQQPDGGWTVTFTAYSPAGALEWRGYATVQAVTVLRAAAGSGAGAAGPETGAAR